MPVAYHRRSGEVPPERHPQHRTPEGGLYQELLDARTGQHRTPEGGLHQELLDARTGQLSNR